MAAVNHRLSRRFNGIAPRFLVEVAMGKRPVGPALGVGAVAVAAGCPRRMQVVYRALGFPRSRASLLRSSGAAWSYRSRRGERDRCCALPAPGESSGHDRRSGAICPRVQSRHGVGVWLTGARLEPAVGGTGSGGHRVTRPRSCERGRGALVHAPGSPRAHRVARRTQSQGARGHRILPRLLVTLLSPPARGAGQCGSCVEETARRPVGHQRRRRAGVVGDGERDRHPVPAPA